jgi:hypothetical protein
MSTKNEDMLEELIKKGESETLEFKSAMRALRASTQPDLAIMSLQDEHYQYGASSRGRILQHCIFVIITSLLISSLYPILIATILLPYYLAVFLYLLF